MRDYDLEFLFAFVKRAGMYTCSTEDFGYKGIGNYLHAYELGSQHTCRFRSTLIEQLSKKYEIPSQSQGLEKQLQLVADKIGVEWHILFQQEAYLILEAESDKNEKSRFAQIIRNNILKELNQIGDTLPNYWRINWNHIIHQVNEWKGITLTDVEKKKFTNLLERFQKLVTGIRTDEVDINEVTKKEIAELKIIIQKSVVDACRIDS